MPIVNLMLWGALVLAALLVYLLIVNYNQAEREAARELAQLKKPTRRNCTRMAASRSETLLMTGLSVSKQNGFINVGKNECSFGENTLEYRLPSAVRSGLDRENCLTLAGDSQHDCA